MFALAVTFTIDPPHMGFFKVAMLKNAKTSLANEPGCQQFDVCMDASRPEEVFLYEIYDDESAFKAHTDSAHYAAFQSIIEGMVTGKDVRFFSEVHQ